DAGGGGPLSLRITVLPAELASVIASVQVLPSTTKIGTGGRATFECVVTSTDDRRLSLEPTWLASSAIGSIDDGGQFTALGEPGSGEVVAVVGNLAGSAQVSVATLGGGPPEVLGLAADPDRTLGHSEPVVLTASVQDPDGDSVSYDWTATAGSIEGSGASVTWTAPDVSGAFAVSCVVSDPDGQSDALVRTIHVGAGGVGVGIESTGGQAQ
ncbi:MAG: PKD domain-containing protein, partial [Armatimonadia bacterium]|nr:PKD domain-containing protein [Armatimonadia bacterium]